MSHDPRALLLTESEVADRIGRSVSTVKRCRLATKSDNAIRPMPGWLNIGSESKPEYRLPESALIDWIEGAQAA